MQQQQQQQQKPQRKVVVSGGGNKKRIIPQGKPREQELANPNKLRVISGRAKGMKIESPDVYLRPMMAKVSCVSLNMVRLFMMLILCPFFRFVLQSSVL